MAEASPGAAQETRQPLTILFTDIVGSSAVFAQRGDAVGMALITRHNALLMPVVTRAGGRVIKTIGDSILATFANPGQAVRAAWAMQRALSAANEKSVEGERIHIRVGVHYGLVYEKKGDVFGDAVNMAERVKSKAGAGQVVLSRVVRDLLRADPAIEVRSLGPTELKGSPEAVELFELTSAPAPGPSRLLAAKLHPEVWHFGVVVALLLFAFVGVRLFRQAPSEPATATSKPPAAIAEVTLRHWSEGGEARDVSPEGSILISGEKFQVQHRPMSNHFLYAAFYNAESKSFTLVFPAADTLQPLRAGETVVLPPGGGSFVLDNQPRTETILLIFAAGPVPALEEVARSGDPSPGKLRDILQQIRSRPGSQARFAAAGAAAGRVESVMDSGPVWMELKINHR